MVSNCASKSFASWTIFSSDGSGMSFSFIKSRSAARIILYRCSEILIVILNEPSLSSAFVTDLWTRLGALFPPNAFPDVAVVQSRWAEVEREQVELVNRVTNESLGRMVPVRTTQISLAHLMQHLANHSTYHRGQVALKMRQLAAAPVATDFALFLLEGRPEAADAR